ncbi:type IV pilus modification protein PilV [Thiocapsa sp.]|uniref:type IV pilus modification protein PilV n=1 Tax=Thiocapsa sp. TaxID=2024551 RepID=UPI0025CE1422|nr:type IV pilus modification protein PilV [Thiocapsa sp.]
MILRQQQRQRGFTLIEALISLVVLSLGLFGLMQIQTRVMTETGDSKTQTVAVNLAQEKLEELRASDYAAISGGEDLIPAAAGGTTDFSRTWTATPSTDPPYNEVSVTTRWTRPGEEGKDADSPSVTLTTFIAESAAVALDTIGDAGEDSGDSGNGDDASGENNSEDGDEPGGQDDSGGDDGNSNDESSEDDDVSGPGSCSCFYGQNKNEIKLVESNGSCCSAAFCETKAPDGIKKNTSFIAICPH